MNDRSRLAELIREAADSVEATPPDTGVGGTLGDAGGTVGAFALIDDDETWQATMRRQLDEAVMPPRPGAGRG